MARWGGFDFNADARNTTVFNGASAVEFWAKSPNGIPDGFVFRASDISQVESNDLRLFLCTQLSRLSTHFPCHQGACKEYRLEEGATLDTANGWTRFSFPISDFECGQGVRTAAYPAAYLAAYFHSSLFHSIMQFFITLLVWTCICLQMLNRIQWENKSESKQSICVKDVRIIAEEASAVAAAGRR